MSWACACSLALHGRWLPPNLICSACSLAKQRKHVHSIADGLLLLQGALASLPASWFTQHWGRTRYLLASNSSMEPALYKHLTCLHSRLLCYTPHWCKLTDLLLVWQVHDDCGLSLYYRGHLSGCHQEPDRHTLCGQDLLGHRRGLRRPLRLHLCALLLHSTCSTSACLSAWPACTRLGQAAVLRYRVTGMHLAGCINAHTVLLHALLVSLCFQLVHRLHPWAEHI